MVPTKKTLQPLLFIQPWISSATTLPTGKPFHRSMLLLTWMQQIQGVLIFICMGPDVEPRIDLLLLRQWATMQLSVTDKWNHHVLSSLRGFSLLFKAVGGRGCGLWPGSRWNMLVSETKFISGANSIPHLRLPCTTGSSALLFFCFSE